LVSTWRIVVCALAIVITFFRHTHTKPYHFAGLGIGSRGSLVLLVIGGLSFMFLGLGGLGYATLRVQNLPLNALSDLREYIEDQVAPKWEATNVRWSLRVFKQHERPNRRIIGMLKIENIITAPQILDLPDNPVAAIPEQSVSTSASTRHTATVVDIRPPLTHDRRTQSERIAAEYALELELQRRTEPQLLQISENPVAIGASAQSTNRHRQQRHANPDSGTHMLDLRDPLPTDVLRSSLASDDLDQPTEPDVPNKRADHSQNRNNRVAARASAPAAKP
jgi:hypothetical protein